MKKHAPHLDKFLPRTRRAFGFGALIALAILAATIFLGLLFVRALVREQIIRRDAEALYATTLMEQLDFAETPERNVHTDEHIGFHAAIRASRLQGVVGIRFYDKQGRFTDAFPATIQPQPLPADAQACIGTFKPCGLFHSKMPIDEIFIYLPEFESGAIAESPILLVSIPLHQRDTEQLAGTAQFIIEGRSMLEEFSRLDRRLFEIALITFIASGALLLIMIGPIFARSQHLYRELANHSRHLQKANEELALTARISAVGAVSSHLMHGLKNPLASLSQFVTSHNLEAPEETSADWEDALAASRRMQMLVERTLEVLSDVKGEPTYELTVGELGDDTLKRIQSKADSKKVRIAFEAEGNCRVSSRTANLAALILVNLLENAIEASAPGSSVQLAVSRNRDQLFFRVIDEGPGIPAERYNTLFLPGKSTREGGSGIGLAISKQISDYLGAELKLEKSSAEGSVFLLILPLSVCLDPPA